VSYIFLNRYCKVTANLPVKGIVTLTGWIITANSNTLILQDENDMHNLIKRENIIGSIVVLMEQKPLNDLRIFEETGVLKEREN
jgi:hypothetical protein